MEDGDDNDTTTTPDAGTPPPDTGDELTRLRAEAASWCRRLRDYEAGEAAG